MKFICTNCNKELSANDIFCPNCGCKNTSLEKNKNNKFGLPIILLIICYCLHISLQVINGITMAKFFKDLDMGNPFLKPSIFVWNFLIGYIFIFILVFLQIFNKKKQNKAITKTAFFLISFIIGMTVILNILSLIDNGNSSVIAVINKLFPFWFFLSDFSYLIKDKYFDWRMIYEFVISIVYFTSLGVTFKNILSSMKNK